MWLLLAPAPIPDATVWPGRRMLAAIDAVAWPAAWIAAVHLVPMSTGVAGPLVVALAAVAAGRRIYRALLANHRYQFTTWKWGRRLVFLLATGFALKLAMATLAH